MTLIDEVAEEDEFADIHYTKPHWARATTETPVWIRDEESVVALIGHRLEINLMSMDDQPQARMEDTRIDLLYRRVCPNVRVKVDDMIVAYHMCIIHVLPIL